ncbi:hypothetical protein TYRP_006932 [Tyrophagus putrescentiae]|nr:hypothetical protein TYRP_006932 [Tyrophagus putrescentiae]
MSGGGGDEGDGPGGDRGDRPQGVMAQQVSAAAVDVLFAGVVAGAVISSSSIGHWLGLATSARSRFASSMKGRFSDSVSCFQSAPSRLLISLLCIFGFSWAILRRCPRDQT